jgi:hypothetical protein
MTLRIRGETGMTEQDVVRQLAQECPRKILGLLHLQGHYLHCTSARFPGKVLCFHKDSELPPDWQPTPAQEAILQRQQHHEQGATG